MQNSVIIVVKGVKFFFADIAEVVALENGRIKAKTLLTKYADGMAFITDDTKNEFPNQWDERRHLELLTNKERNYVMQTKFRAVWVEGKRKKSAFKMADKFWQSDIGIPFMFNDEFYIVPSGDAQAFVLGYMSFSDVTKTGAIRLVEFKNYVLV